MHVITMRMALVMSGMASECGFGARCRGMLAAHAQGVAAGAYGATEGRHGLDHNPPKGFPGRADTAGCEGGAGSSRPQGRRSKGGRHLEGESTSESD